MRRPVCLGLLAVVAVGVLATPWLPFVNRPVLWFGLPAVMVWVGLLVLVITPLLAVLELGRRDAAGPRDDDGVEGEPR